MDQSPDGSRQFSQTEQAAHDHTGHPSRVESDWSETAVTSAKLMRSHLQNSRSGPPFHDRIIYGFCCIHLDYRLIYLCILHYVLFLILFCDFMLCVLFPSGGG